MNQMQEMQITSPGYHQNSPSGPLVGSLPSETSFAHYQHRHNNFFNANSPISNNQNSSNHGSLSEYGTPNTWSPLNQNMLHGNGAFDFVMEDLTSQVRQTSRFNNLER